MNFDRKFFVCEYSTMMLQWALCPPGYKKDWIFGVRDASNDLCAFIALKPVQVMINGKELNVAECNYMCINEDLRSKGLARKLIKEAKRRANKSNYWQGKYNTMHDHPTAYCSSQYYYKALRP